MYYVKGDDSLGFVFYYSSNPAVLFYLTVITASTVALTPGLTKEIFVVEMDDRQSETRALLILQSFELKLYLHDVKRLFVQITYSKVSSFYNFSRVVSIL